MSLGQSDHYQRRIPPKQIECESRLGVSPCREQFRMEFFAKGILGDKEKFWPTKNRSFCIQSLPPAETACNLEIRPQQYRYQFNATKLESRSGLLFPSILHDKSGSSKSNKGKSGTYDNSKSSVAYPDMLNCFAYQHKVHSCYHRREIFL